MEMETIGCLALDIGVAAKTLAGVRESGDRHVVCPYPGGVLLGVLDGLGHGPEASEASRIASDTLEKHAKDSVASLFLRCHERLRFARGAVMTLASIRFDERKMTWAGVGNIDGILLRRLPQGGRGREFLLLKSGIVGMRIPFLEPVSLAIAPSDTLLLLTDGVHLDTLEMLGRDLPPQRLADEILACHGTGTDDALVLVARCLEEAS